MKVTWLTQAGLLFASENVPQSIKVAVDTIRNNIHDELRVGDLAVACGIGKEDVLEMVRFCMEENENVKRT